MRNLLAPLALAAAVAVAGAEEIDLTGELLVVYADDFDNHRAEVVYLLQDPRSHRTVRLRTRDGEAPRHWRSGTRLRVRGKAVAAPDGELVVAANDSHIEVLELPPVAVSGYRHTLVILINFSNAANECSPAAVSNLVFGAVESVNRLYQETSGGLLSFGGIVVGPYTINHSSAGPCDYTAWANAADAAAAAAGVNLGQFQHKIYVLPKRNPCSWAGLGTVGGNPSRAWVARCDAADVYAHELGHNLGMHHAATDANNDGVSDCEYCDNSDIMGYTGPGLRGLNGPHREQMGWLPPGKAVSVSGEATVYLAPLALDGGATPYPQLLKIARPGGASPYYVSYRRPLGCDAALGAGYIDRASVHHFAGGGARTHLVATLTDNGSFVDGGSGLVIRQLAHHADFVALQVSYQCRRAAPRLQALPDTVTVAPGDSGQLTVHLFNSDSAACGASTWQVQPVGPAGWSVTAQPASVTVAPGQSASLTLTVTAPSWVGEGAYPVGIQVSDNFHTVHAGSLTAGCVVAVSPLPADQTAPTAPAGLQAVGLKKRVVLRWWPATDDRGVAGYRIYRDGVLVATTRATRWADRRTVRGLPYQYVVTAVDAAGNESAPSETVGATASGR